MAWSDNIVAFANSPSRVARVLSIIARQLESMHLHIKDGSLEIVPASTRRQRWAAIRDGPYEFTVTDETKILGYYVACNGDTGRSRATLIGALRGRLSSMDKRFSLASTAARARWCRQQYCGFVGFFAAFLGIDCTILRQMGIICNLGARQVYRLPRSFNSHVTLRQIRQEFNINAEYLFV